MVVYVFTRDPTLLLSLPVIGPGPIVLCCFSLNLGAFPSTTNLELLYFELACLGLSNAWKDSTLYYPGPTFWIAHNLQVYDQVCSLLHASYRKIFSLDCTFAREFQDQDRGSSYSCWPAWVHFRKTYPFLLIGWDLQNCDDDMNWVKELWLHCF